jgi:UDP-GlcNAc:undecaprenyl-phosphate/decaprenyl-phosphate GlcNAc-1-phosphate transferase
MILALSLATLSFLFALLLTPIIRDYFIKCGVVDHPDGVRKIHDRPIPRVGGIGIALSYVLSVGILTLIPFPEWGNMRLEAHTAWAIFGGSLVIFLTGLLDDFINIRAWQKFLAQIMAASVIFGSGTRISLGLGAGTEYESLISFLLTVVWLVGCTNAFNLIDGLDGLASGVGLFATVTILIAGVIHNNTDLILLTLPLAGSLLGFLRYNFNPASIFLGDCGSMLIGFLLGCFAIEWSHKSATLLGLTAPMMAFAVPLLDVCLSVLRRFLRNRPVFGADRGHIHHRLLDRGLNPRQAALVAYGFSCLGACFSLVQNSLHRDFGGVIIVLFCLAAWIGIQNLGYVEFSMASRLLLRGGVGRMIDFESKLRHFEDNLAKAETLEEVWDNVRRASRDLGFHGSRLSLFGRVNVDLDEGFQESMQVRIPLAGDNYVNFYGIEGRLQAIDLNSFLPAVTSTLNQKIDELTVRIGAQREAGTPPGRPKLIKSA